MRIKGMLAGACMLFAVPLAAQGLYFYPSQGQSPEQQQRDQGECHAWAVQQTGFDPSYPPPSPRPAPQFERTDACGSFPT